MATNMQGQAVCFSFSEWAPEFPINNQIARCGGWRLRPGLNVRLLLNIEHMQRGRRAVLCSIMAHCPLCPTSNLLISPDVLEMECAKHLICQTLLALEIWSVCSGPSVQGSCSPLDTRTEKEDLCITRP